VTDDEETPTDTEENALLWETVERRSRH